ncbi:hypothetical protein SAMN05216344_10458 [Polaromonas sp. OV174]|uniref:hypothetical protein n=1 Tax=Polaromonas sp. OV174 TaxID=1855300 RepID=UPI0008F3BD23|nr:hypothetical protein [Polaromonas sp. OV174]SFB83794.1 hypothetical protein SAMN05216344_10458 [Polaromonas sp. OV174]
MKVRTTKPGGAEPVGEPQASATETAKPQVALIPAPRRIFGFPASVAEFLLLFRLRVRRSSALSVDVLERAARVVLVTCQNWFSPGTAPKSGPGKRS